MKNLITTTLLLFFYIGINAQNTYFPQVFFNKKLAADKIALGNAVIEGTASTKQKTKMLGGLVTAKPLLGEKHYAPKGTVIMLFPVTPYFEDWYKMRKKMENKNTQVLMSEDAFKYRIEATTDEYGRFKFEQLKPGKYYLETVVNFTAKGTYREQTGTSTAYNAFGQALYSSPVYDTFFYNYASGNRESKFVEITKDGEVISIKL